MKNVCDVRFLFVVLKINQHHQQSLVPYTRTRLKRCIVESAHLVVAKKRFEVRTLRVRKLVLDHEFLHERVQLFFLLAGDCSSHLSHHH